MLLYRSQGLCLGEDQRDEYDCYLYEFGDKRECVSSKECVLMRLNAYYEARACVSVEPASDGNFLKRSKYVWSCSYERFGIHTVYESVLHLGDVARCLTKAACSGIYKLDPSN